MTGDLRCRLPMIFEGSRRCGKTTKLMELFNTAYEQEKDVYIVVVSAQFKEVFCKLYDIPENRILHTKDQIERACTGKNVFLADEWWLLKDEIQRELILRSWDGDEVIGFGTFDEKLRIMQFNQHFETNPNMTTEDMNDFLSLVMGRPEKK